MAMGMQDFRSQVNIQMCHLKIINAMIRQQITDKMYSINLKYICKIIQKQIKPQYQGQFLEYIKYSTSRKQGLSGKLMKILSILLKNNL